jgi:hypothetical protein
MEIYSTNPSFRGIYSDNFAMARRLQWAVPGMPNAETASAAIPVLEVQFAKLGDPRYFWTQRVVTRDEEIILTSHKRGQYSSATYSRCSAHPAT